MSIQVTSVVDNFMRSQSTTAMVSALGTISTINGGTAANDDVTIQGTTNATRTTSYVNLQPNGGLVGIGTATPLLPLHLVASQAGAGLVRVQNTAATGYTGIELYGDAGTQLAAVGVGNSSAAAFPGELYIGTNTTKPINFYTTIATNVKMMVSGAGGVSIGSTADAGAGNLFVNGTISSYGTYTSSTIYERAILKFNSPTSTFQLGTEKGSGGGSARNLDFVRAGTVMASIDSGGFTGPTDVFGGNTFTVSGYARLVGSIISLGASSACTFLIEGAVQRKMIFGSDWACGFSSVTTGNETSMRSGIDVAISRLSPGVLGVGDGTAGNTTGFVQDVYRTKGTGAPNPAVNAVAGAVYHRIDSNSTIPGLYINKSTMGYGNEWFPVTESPPDYAILYSELPYSPSTGMRRVISDCTYEYLAANLGSSAGGSGIFVCPIFYNGASWVVG